MPRSAASDPLPEIEFQTLTNTLFGCGGIGENRRQWWGEV